VIAEDEIELLGERIADALQRVGVGAAA